MGYELDFMPSGSARVRTSSSKRRGLRVNGMCWWTRRCSQKASESAGMLKAVWVTSPAPAVPRLARGQGKKVRMVPGEPSVVAEVEVVGAGVVEVDGALDEAEAEDLGVEVEVGLGVGGDGGDVVETDDGLCRHGRTSSDYSI